MKSDPGPYIQQPAQTHYIQQPAPQPTALDWFKELNAFWTVGILPLVILWVSIQKNRKHNARRRQRYQEENREHEFSDDTVIDFMRKQMKKEDDNGPDTS